METKPLTLKDLFRREVRFVVPLFQRSYVWDCDTNWEPLWQDVMTACRQTEASDVTAPHFLGAVVLDLVKGGTGTTEVRQVIDGQQRLTTLQLLIAAIRDVGVELELSDRDIRSLRRLTVNDDEMSDDPDDVFKVWPTNSDRSAFRDTLSAGSAAALSDRYSQRQPTIVQAYLFFSKTVRQWLLGFDEGGRDKAFDRLVSVLNHGLQAVVIDLGEKDNPQVIFESLNARGTPLQASDLVRNFLFHEAERNGLSVEQLYQQHWARFDDGYWRQEVRQGRLLRPRLDAFLAHFLTMELVQEIPTHQLYLTFQRYVRKSDRSLTEIMARLASYGDVYGSLDTGNGLATREQDFVRRLGTLDTTVVMPVLLLVFGEHDSSVRVPVLGVLESYLLRRMVCRLTSKNYNRLMLDMLKRLKSANSPAQQVLVDFLAGQTVDSNYWPSDEDVRHAIGVLPLYRQLTRGRLRMLLDLANQHQQTGKTEQVVRRLDRLTIEHLLPQSWQQHWPLQSTEDHGRLQETEQRQHHLHTLGNLTLTTEKLNRLVSNGDWASKRRAILAHSALDLNRSLPETWDVDAIIARGRHLADVLCSALPRPSAGGRTVTEQPDLSLEADEDLDLSQGDDDQDIEPEIRSSPARNRRRDVAAHILEVLHAQPIGTVLTVSQIATSPSSEYPNADVSAGAVSQRLRAGTVSGVQSTTNSAGSLAATLTA